MESLNNSAVVFIHPNPSDGSFVIEWLDKSSGRLLTIRVIDEMGNQLFFTTEKTSGNLFKKEIDVGTIASGIYFIEVTSEQDCVREKIQIY
jgi:hypothetical protein